MHLLSTLQVIDAFPAEQIFFHQLAAQTFSKAQTQRGAFDLRLFRVQDEMYWCTGLNYTRVLPQDTTRKGRQHERSQTACGVIWCDDAMTSDSTPEIRNALHWNCLNARMVYNKKFDSIVTPWNKGQKRSFKKWSKIKYISRTSRKSQGNSATKRWALFSSSSWRCSWERSDCKPPEFVLQRVLTQRKPEVRWKEASIRPNNHLAVSSLFKVNLKAWFKNET